MATRWGIISAGRISHDFVTCLRSMSRDEHQIVAVAARNVVNAKKFAERHHIATVFDNYDAMTACDVDIVYIGALNTEHYNIAKNLLSGGKAVLCEKPMTMTLKQTEELIKIAREKKVFLMEAMWSRFLPIYREMMEKHLPSMGEIHQVQVAFGLKVIEDSERVVKPALGGSSILDIGIYAINFAQMMFKDEMPVEVKAVGEVNSEGVDINTAMIFKYPNGRIASLTTSVTADLSCEAKAIGKSGTLTLSKCFWCTDKMVLPDGKEVHIPFPDTIEPCVYDNSTGLRYEAMHVRECLKKGLTESPIMSLDVSRTFAFLMESCMKQIGTIVRA